MKRLFSSFFAVGLLVTGAGSAENTYPAKPKAVLERYLALDADAAGLAPETWQELGQYTTFAQAPKWESFVVIDRYEIGKIMEGSTRAQIRVTYHPLGKLSNTFTADTSLENVLFYLNKVKGQWKVDGPTLVPHVSFAVMEKRLNASSAANPKEKKANDELLRQIEAARQTAK